MEQNSSFIYYLYMSERGVAYDLCMCLCVCMCVWLYVCLCVYVCVSVCVCMCVWGVCLCVCICVYMCVYVGVNVFICECVCVCVFKLEHNGLPTPPCSVFSFQDGTKFYFPSQFRGSFQKYMYILFQIYLKALEVKITEF